MSLDEDWSTEPATKADRRRAEAADRERIGKQDDDARRAHGAAQEAERGYADAYKRGLAGESMVHLPDDDPEIRRRHSAGLAERARRDRRQLYARTGAHLTATARATKRAARRGTPLGGGGSWSAVGVGVAVLGVIALYLLLGRAGLAAKVTTGVLGAVQWFVSPSTLPI
ncbi:MAG TPA: hypothetical protein VFP61_07600 [Acidimicrobiales bacterium]|nr:hypothetical protein [Acidimicrobiales bacterium]